jgi:hypothetical protein
MAFSCELPPELLRIVKDYAQPAFIHWRLFNAAKEVVAKRHLVDLMEALCEPNADELCASLKLYLSAVRAKDLSETQLSDYKASLGDFGAVWCHETQSVLRTVLTPEQQNTKARLTREANLTLSNESNAYRVLMVHIYGEESVAYAEELDERRELFGFDDDFPLTLRDWDA